MRGTILTLIAGMALMAGPGASASHAGLVAGKGKKKTNCYVEYDVGGVTSPGPQVQKNGALVVCMDGDPCDTDGQCTNNSCTVSVAPCANQSDPNAAACTPPSGLQSMTVKAGKQPLASPASLTGPGCATPSGVTVKIPMKKGKPKKFGAVTIKSTAKALAGVKPGGAKDQLQIRCIPRPASNACQITVEECYNGKLDPGEACDAGRFDTDACVACKGPNACGDSFKGSNEECDDGNTAGGDGCSPDCQIEGGGLAATVSLNYDTQLILELVGVELNVFYPAVKVAIPGTGDTDQVNTRVSNLGNTSNNFRANDRDDHLFIVSGGTDASAFTPGPMAKVIFDLLPGQVPAASEFSCQVANAFDSLGLQVGPPTCSVAIATTP